MDIDHVAKLAKLSLSQDERDLLAKQLPTILAYVGRLQDADTSGIDAKAYLTDATNVFREDIVASDAALRDTLIAMFPKRMGDALEVPGVFAE
ncbi:MAG: Asp-tRNA(Asn)/Glu-tRNA(Gln) amidotransferase subunit GatC [Candidatus Uhrbacteria bacterium]|nr:Asp-tRNA(Asn)/Glu-tRNA(Gln) amidotransferase subunit GatC [Candidatus Uhrbacteria bacterium]